MRQGQASRTAVRVASTLLTLNEVPAWSGKLPAGLAAETEAILLKAGLPGVGPAFIADCKSPRTVANFSRYERWVPGMFEGFGRRKCFMEAAFEGAMADGIDQVVIIGAGFDTLALRQAPAHRHVTFVEIDHPATQAAKRRGLQGVDLPANLVFLAADLGVTSLAEELERLELSGQYDRSKASFAILEGLLMYLSARDVRHVFQKLSVSAATGSRAAFSHLVSLNQHYVTQGIVRLMGEPWRSACRPDALSSYLPGPWQVTETAPLVTPRDLEGYAIAARNAA